MSSLEIYAHRGLAAKYPENTKKAFEEACKVFIKHNLRPKIELDIQLTKDNKLIITHDDNLSSTTNISGLVKDYNLEDIKKFKTRKRNTNDFSNEKLITFEEFLIEAKKYKKKPMLQIELKSSGVVKDALDCLKKYKFTEKDYFFVSFKPESLFELQNISKKSRKLFLIDPRIPLEQGLIQVEKLQKSGLSIQGVGLGDNIPEHPDWGTNRLNTSIIKKFKSKALEIGVFVINDVSRAEELLEMGIKGFVTDRIDLILGGIKKT